MLFCLFAAFLSFCFENNYKKPRSSGHSGGFYASAKEGVPLPDLLREFEKVCGQQATLLSPGNRNHLGAGRKGGPF